MSPDKNVKVSSKKPGFGKIQYTGVQPSAGNQLAHHDHYQIQTLSEEAGLKIQLQRVRHLSSSEIYYFVHVKNDDSSRLLPGNKMKELSLKRKHKLTDEYFPFVKKKVILEIKH